MKTSVKKMSEVLEKREYDKVRAIIDFIEENGKITPKEAEKITKKSTATVRRYLKMLVSTGCVIAEGNTNTMTYQMSDGLPNDI